MLRIYKRVLDEILVHARRDLPFEACGCLAGKDGTVTVHYEMTNTDASTEHFSFDVKEQFRVLKNACSKGLKIMATYHSHPATPARPSDEDIKLANDPDVSYVIVSLMDGNEQIKSFRIRNGSAEDEIMEVLSGRPATH